MLRYERDGHLALLTLDDPATRNALSGDALFAAFEAAAARMNADIGVRVAILTGAGPVFCSGGNVREMRDGTGMFGGSPEEVTRKYRAGIQRIPRAMASLDVPIIAAVNGAAVGAGFDLACMCDVRIAATSATFAQSFVKLGIIAGDGGAWFLPRVVGVARASELAFTGETIDAEQALAWGLVARVVPPEVLMQAARALADRIAANPPLAVRAMKQLMRQAHGATLDVMLDRSAEAQGRMHDTADHREAVAAMFEKRAPTFEGR